MAHQHHHHTPPPVVEGRTGFRRRAAFIIGGLTSGHGVFHWIAQSFIVVLPEVRDLLLGGSVIAVTSIQTTREIMSGVVSLPGGVLTDALRRYWGWVMAVCMALFGVGWLLMAAAGWQAPGSAWLTSQESVAASESSSLNPAGYALLIIGMAVVAVAASVWHLPAMAALSSHFSHRRGSVLSFHGVGGNVGDVLGPVLTGLLLATLTWQAIISIYAAVPIFLAFLVFWAFRDIGERAQTAADEHEQPTDTMRAQVEETKVLVRNPRIWGITIVAGLRGMAYIGFITVLPLYLADVLGLTSSDDYSDLRNLALRGSLIGLLVLVGIFASPLTGYLSDRLGRKLILIPAMLALTVITLLMAPYGDSLAVMSALLARARTLPVQRPAYPHRRRDGHSARGNRRHHARPHVHLPLHIQRRLPPDSRWLYDINPDNLFYYTAALYAVAVVILVFIPCPARNCQRTTTTDTTTIMNANMETMVTPRISRTANPTLPQTGMILKTND